MRENVLEIGLNRDQMVMTTGNSNITGINLEPPGIDDIFRSSPEPGSYYRCPVSTPLHPKRLPYQKIPESITFVSLDFSKVQSDPKQNVHKGLPGSKKLMPRRKNMDYYYVDKTFQKRIAEQSNSTWLRSLCAQPVDEIFTKYRQHSQLQRQQSSLRASTTPGERAILEAWESNSSLRLGSAASVCSRFSTSTQKTVSPQLTLVSKSFRPPPSTAPLSRTDSLVDSHPHPPSIGEDQFTGNVESRVTPRTTPILSAPMDINPFVDDRFYDQFKRQEPRFPDINKRTYSLMNKQRKYLSYGDQFNVYPSPREKSPVPFSGTLSPRKQKPAAMTRSQTCTLCLWEEDSHPDSKS